MNLPVSIPVINVAVGVFVAREHREFTRLMQVSNVPFGVFVARKYQEHTSLMPVSVCICG